MLGATWFVSTGLAAHLPRLLTALGATSEAALLAASLVRPAQVAARVIEFTVPQKASPLVTARLAAGLHPWAPPSWRSSGPLRPCPSCCCTAGATGC